MGNAIGQMLPMAVGVSLSPLPIVAVVFMLVTPRGRVNGPAFIAGWLIGLAIVGTIMLSLAGGAGATDHGEPATWVDAIKLALGVLLLLVGVRQWRGRLREGEEAATPRWMGALDTFGPVKALGAGVLLSGLNPKNLLLTIAGATAIVQTGIAIGPQIVVYVIFILIAAVGSAPVVLYFALGERSRRLLDSLKTWMAPNNAAIMAVLFLIFGVKLIGDAISDLTT